MTTAREGRVPNGSSWRSIASAIAASALIACGGGGGANGVKSPGGGSGDGPESPSSGKSNGASSPSSGSRGIEDPDGANPEQRDGSPPKQGSQGGAPSASAPSAPSPASAGAGGSGGADPATAPSDDSSRTADTRKADDCLKKCYATPSAVSGDALRDKCEKKCGKGSGKVQPK